jgi:hypothetical protein
MAQSALTAHHLILCLPRPFPLTTALTGYIPALVFPRLLWDSPLIFELLGMGVNNAEEPPPPLALIILPPLDNGMRGDVCMGQAEE